MPTNKNSSDRAEQFDLIVVGGGPGGSTVASLVAMKGHKVLLLERESFPRHQIGESLLPATVHGVCTLLGLESELRKAKFTKKRGGTFLWGNNGKPWALDFGISTKLNGRTATAYQVLRSKFDSILLKNAAKKGVDVREKHQVKDVLRENGRVVGVRFTDPSGKVHTARSKFVADASGHQSKIHEIAGKRIYSEFFQNVALYSYFEGGDRLPPPFSGNIFTCAFVDGWFWYIPLSPTLTSVGAVVRKESAATIRKGPAQALQGYIDACPPIRQMLADAKHVSEGPLSEYRIRKDYSYTNSAYWAPGLVLIGDAACFVDPVFSSGVHLATYSALLAARSINTLLDGELSEKRCFTEFEKRYRREYGVFYKFLISFYDQHQDEESYFWSARKVTKSKDRANEAFVNLVSGLSADEGIFATKDGSISPKLGDETELKLAVIDGIEGHAVDSKGKKAARSAQKPLFPGGLIPSPDDLKWREPRKTPRRARR